MTKVEILQKLKALKKQVQKDYKANLEGFFGSYVRGEETSKSDIDILVTFNTGADLFDFVGLNQFLEEELKCRVDVVEKETLRPEIKDFVLSELVSA